MKEFNFLLYHNFESRKIKDQILQNLNLDTSNGQSTNGLQIQVFNIQMGTYLAKLTKSKKYSRVSYEYKQNLLKYR